MATAKSVKKDVAPAKRKTTPPVKSAAKARPAPKTAVTQEPVAKPKAAPKAAPKVAPKAETGRPVRARAKKTAMVSVEQRRNYVEVAAYHIAERRGFAPGDPLADWIQAEAEIDRLIADGLLGA